jgi:hypothetical protein
MLHFSANHCQMNPFAKAAFTVIRLTFNVCINWSLNAFCGLYSLIGITIAVEGATKTRYHGV